MFLKTEKEEKLGPTGQDYDAQRQAESTYYDDGPSIMPASENFAGNQDNWGASATEGWGGAGTGADANDWNTPAATTTATTSAW